MPSERDQKTHTQARFAQHAQEYVASPRHASGADLGRLLALAAPLPDWLVLDIATGGGHTALKFAPHAARVVATDLTLAMLQAAREFIGGQGLPNVEYAAGDAENLPFVSDIFDLVTCRIAPHHFPNCFRFIQECARVLKPGGKLLLQDHMLPEDDRAARYIDSFERLRDPSHNRAFAEYEWRGMFLDAGLSVEHVEPYTKPASLLPWAQMQGCSSSVIERLQILLAQAPRAAADWIHPRCAGTPDAGFDHVYIIISGRKPST